MLFKSRHQSSYKSNFCSHSFHLFHTYFVWETCFEFLLPVSLTYVQAKNVEQQLSLIPDDFLTGCQVSVVCVSCCKSHSINRLRSCVVELSYRRGGSLFNFQSDFVSKCYLITIFTLKDPGSWLTLKENWSQFIKVRSLINEIV